MAEATPITEESTINRSSSHRIGHTYKLQTFICESNLAGTAQCFEAEGGQNKIFISQKSNSSVSSSEVNMAEATL